MGRPRHTQRTKDRVLAEFRRVGRVDLACASQGLDRDVHYGWMRDDPQYKAQFEQAREPVAQLLEDEAVRRAYHGTMKPVAIAGKVYMLTEFSDTLLIFLLKCRNPAVFRDQSRVELSWEGQLKQVLGDTQSLTPEQREQLSERLLALAYGNDPAAIEAAKQRARIEAGVVDAEFEPVKPEAEAEPPEPSAT